jgi:hypothetical protein
MNYSTAQSTRPDVSKPDLGDVGPEGMSLEAFTNIFTEIQEQPAWRAQADREMDYVDGNQLDSEILRKQREVGMPPAIEPLIGPAIDAVTGMEAKTRTDWRVKPDGDQAGEEVAAALNYKLNQAERKSGADQACSEAYRPQVCVGIGWVEVSRSMDPFKYPYRCRAIHRNEIWRDMLAKEPDRSDARYLVRRRWTDARQAELMFPDSADLIRRCAGGWQAFEPANLDGGTSTDLAMAWGQERGWSVEEQEWRDVGRKRVCLFEVWYRIWQRVLVIKTLDGRIVEYDKNNPKHTAAVATGLFPPQWAVVSKVRVAMWLGPHKLSDSWSPYAHNKFPYVEFVGKAEDRTGVPYGLVRGMMYMQDNINASISKIRWGLSAVRTTRTKGAVNMTDAKFRQQIARPDADIVLDPEAMAKPGATFKVERDFQLNEQQYKMLTDARLAIQRVSGITQGFMGQQGTARSGVQEATQVEQSIQALADINDNFKFARAQVGELLLSLIIQDIASKRETVTIPGHGLKADRVIELNVPTADPDTGTQYLTNDVARTLLQVQLDDVPSTPTFRAQQLAAMSEAFKAMPQKFQEAVLPHLLSLMDIPDREEVIRIIREAAQNMTPEEIDQRVAEAVDRALKDAQIDLKRLEMERKYAPELQQAQIAEIVAKAVKMNVEAAFASIQTAGQIVLNPQVAALGDGVMQAMGFQKPEPGGYDPNFPVPAPGTQVPPTGLPQNTSPQQPAVPAAPGAPDSAMRGVETAANETELPA